jgi:ApaG protein
MPDHFDVLWTRFLMYQAVTRNIAVTVSARFMADPSSTDDNKYIWHYTVEIRNRGNTTVQLKSRHWIITDGAGKTEEVRGAGVVGEQPVIEPGEAFEYTSGVPLHTPSGFMTGSYGMVTKVGDKDGERFDIEIPVFSLDSPDAKRTLN